MKRIDYRKYASCVEGGQQAATMLEEYDALVRAQDAICSERPVIALGDGEDAAIRHIYQRWRQVSLQIATTPAALTLISLADRDGSAFTYAEIARLLCCEAEPVPPTGKARIRALESLNARRRQLFAALKEGNQEDIARLVAYKLEDLAA